MNPAQRFLAAWRSLRCLTRSSIPLETAAVEAHAMSVRKNLMLAGHGFTILPPIAFADELARKRVTEAPLCDSKT